jgi:hypothetical protein
VKKLGIKAKTDNFKRITIIVGHYGSGKSEFAINYALYLSKINKEVSLIDLDIASPYFRSREKSKLLNENNIETIFNTFGFDINLDLPSITPIIFGAIENKNKSVVIDCGGDSNGARILLQLKRFLPGNEEIEILCVINGNRAETTNVDGAKRHIQEIEEESGLEINGLVNNTHMLKQTTVEDIRHGQEICKLLNQDFQIAIKINCIGQTLLKEIRANNQENEFNNIFPIHLYLRESWLDL